MSLYINDEVLGDVRGEQYFQTALFLRQFSSVIKDNWSKP